MAGSTLRAELRELESKRYEVMKKIEEAMAFLDTTPVGLRGSLVDSEGFPRDDCDLFAVRRARQTVNCGHNDLKSLETTIHEKLIQLHEECREEAEEQMRRDAMKNNKNNMKVAGDGGEHAQLQKEMADKKPFVRIVRVVSGSPAAEAGLTAEDLVVRYGDLDAEKVLAGGYGEMTRVTSSHEGKMMRVWVRSASGEGSVGSTPMLSLTFGMGPYTRIVSVYERFTILSNATIKREVGRMLHPLSVGPSHEMHVLQRKQQHLLLSNVCDLLVKSGEWQRALVVAEFLPPAQQKVVVAAVGQSQNVTRNTKGSIVSGPFVSSNLHEVSVEDLMRTAFALQRCNASKVTSSREGTDTATETHMEGSGVEMQQQQLFKELSRRHRYNELMQCVVNWKSRGLIPTKQSKASLRRLEADGVDGTQSRGSNEQVDGAVTASVPFQATSTDASEGATEMVTTFNAEKALQALLFTSTSGSQWEEAMRHHPTFFVQMLRDPTAALQLLRKIGPEALSKLLLSVIINCNAGTAVSASPWMGRVQDGDISWDVVASLCFVLRQHIAHRKKVENVDILQALRDALRKGANATTIIKDGAMKFGPQAAAQRGAASTVATQSFSNHRVRAIRSSVEGLCAALAHHNEPQARFIGLLLFADIALALCNCCVALPNSLVQCIFLCIGDPQCHGQRELGPPSSVDAIQWDRKLVTELISAPPAERWLPALQLLQKCSQQRCFVVTSAHLRCLLSGLQSVSVRRMWAAALSAASSLITQQHIFPDEQSMEKLMLNLHAASWKRAFEVLKLYEKKHVPPSPIILRDLHVVSMKHGTWDMVLRVMHKIEEVGHQQAGFMNYVYCLRAFGCAGKWDKAAKMFAQLKDVPGAIPSRSAFNENTVAVPALAMMENNHWEEVMQFMKSIWMIVGPELTREGAEVSRAAEFLALVHIGDIERVASFLNSYCGYPSNAAAAKARTKGLDSTVLSSGELRAVVVRAAQLQTLLGMEHLNAPVRLVFDLLSADKSDANVERITSSMRSRSSRQVLYLPPQHVQKQYKWMAVTMGRMVRDGEHLFYPPAQQVVAEAMSAIGAGSVYLEVALM